MGFCTWGLTGFFTRFVGNWVAGEDRASAVRAAAAANRRGVAGIINSLGEHVPGEGVDRVVEEYLALLTLIAEEKVDSSISVKPTQLGLDVDSEVFRRSLGRIVEAAGRLGVFVWIDMESYRYLPETLEVYEGLVGRFRNVGVTVQAALHRSEGDVRRLLSRGGRIRLCKGAYRESPAVALRRESDVVASFSRLLRLLFEEGEGFAVATHDAMLISEAEALSRSHPVGFEFQMLKGVGEDLKRRLVGRGYRVAEYIPYGRDWLPYVLRRLRERPSSTLLFLKSVVRR